MGGGMSVRFLDTREILREVVCIYHYTVTLLYSAEARDTVVFCMIGNRPYY
jgi:hypothetical protein